MSDLPRLLLCSFDVIPGPTGFSRRLTEYLKGVGSRYSVVVLSTKTADVSHIERYHGSRLLRVPVGTGDLTSRLQSFERAVRRQLESEEYALAHVTDPFGGYVIAEQKAQCGYRVIYEASTFPSQELPGTLPALDGDRRSLAKIRRQELFCLMNADVVITGSQVTRQFIQSLGVGADAIRVHRAPVDLSAYHAKLPDPDGTPMRIGYLGSHLPWQGLSTLLDALPIALQQVDLRLTLIGPRHPEWSPRLDDQIAQLNLQEKVDLQPPVPHDDLAKVLADVDVGVAPLEDVDRNRLQGGPLAKISEYLAAARPVIAADLPIARELIPENAGLFFPPGDADALAARLVELARNPRRRVELGKRGRAEAQRSLDAAVVRGKLVALYDELLGRRTAAGTATREEQPAPPPPTLTATPTSRVLGKDDSGPTPTNRGVPAPPTGSGAETLTAPAPTRRTDSSPGLPQERPLRDTDPAHRAARDLSKRDTDPDAKAPSSPGIVLGTPLRPPTAPVAPAVHLTPSPDRQSFANREPSGPKPLPPIRGGKPTPLPPAPQPVAVAPTPEPVAREASEEPEEISPDEVIEQDLEVSMVTRLTRMDPWFAQLVHGYCPPEGIQFERHTPPNSLPGKEDVRLGSKPPNG